MKLPLMLEELINLEKKHAGTAVFSNPAIPDQHNDTVIAKAGNSITDGLKNRVSRPRARQVLNLFSHGADISANPAIQNISGGGLDLQGMPGRLSGGQGFAGGHGRQP
ncbi:MAG: hypothetical protein P4L51_25825 [Puia sp.]|nr:hypothetical protein [Puia sp.]